MVAGMYKRFMVQDITDIGVVAEIFLLYNVVKFGYIRTFFGGFYLEVETMSKPFLGGLLW